jgi:choline kinase
MKAVILAGGLGSRISEESVSKPKPMMMGPLVLTRWSNNHLMVN